MKQTNIYNHSYIRNRFRKKKTIGIWHPNKMERSYREIEWVTNEAITRTRISTLGFSFFKFQYNLYMSDTLVSEAMASSTGSEEHQTSSSSMMFKSVNDIQSRLGKVLYTSNKHKTKTKINKQPNQKKKQQTYKKQKHIQN